MKDPSYPNLLVVLVALLMLGLPRSGWAQFNFITNADNTITITGYTGPGGNVTIPSRTNDYPVTAIGTDAFEFNNTITSVKIPDSVTSIGDWAFTGCQDLTNVTIGSSVGSIGYNAFDECYNLMSVTIPDSVTSIGESAFFDCSGLTSVTIGNGVTSIGYEAFYDCSGLTNIEVDAANPSYASASGVLFNNTLTRLIQYPGSLAGSYAIPNSVTNIGVYAFENCSGLTSVTIPDSVTSIGEYAFENCYNLMSLTIGNSVTSIGTSAFYDCYNLMSVTIPASVTSIGDGAFWWCPGLTNIEVDAANPVYASAGKVLFNKTLTTLIQYPGGLAGSYAIPNSVINIGVYAFEYCSGLTSVTIPASVTSIGVYAFEYCTNLHQAYFQGNAPSVYGAWAPPIRPPDTVFYGESGTVFYVPGTTGWGPFFFGWPTAPWYQPRPQILGSGHGLGVGSNGFQFTISWATNAAVVVEASTNLQDWTPVSTNTLVSGTSLFWDSDWTNHPQRFYRVGVEQ